MLTNIILPHCETIIAQLLCCLLLGRSDALLGCLDDMRLRDAKLLVQGGGRGRGTERVNANVLATPADVPVPAE